MGTLRSGRLDDSRFIACAYRQLFGRSADPRGFAEGRDRLRRGTLRGWMLLGWLDSDEAKAHLSVSARDQARSALPGARALWAGTAALRALRWLRSTFLPSLSQRPRHVLAAPALTPRTSDVQPHAGAKRSRRVVVTIAAANYLAQASVLFRSLAEHEPGCDHVWLLVGDDPVAADLLPQVRIMRTSDIGIEGLADMSLRYDLLELSTAVKPFVLRWLLSTECYERAIYLDPDIQLFAPLQEVFAALDDGISAVATPHLLQPLSPPGEPNDHTILRSGVFNLGFVAFARNEETARFLDWWARQLRTQCLVAFERNLFTDQRWCDLLPCFISRLLVLRHPGYNVAYWNIEHRPLVYSQQGWTAGGEPLVFFHFSGFDARRPEAFSRHQTRLSAAVLDSAQPLLTAYAKALQSAGWRRGGAPATGLSPTSLPPLLRSFYRELFPEPQAGTADVRLQALLETALSTDYTGLPALLRHLYRSRFDLRESFRFEEPFGTADFADWVADCALDDLGLRPLAALPD